MKKIAIIVGFCLSVMATIAQVEHKESHYPNGNLRYEGDFKDGKPVGELRRYHENGQLSGVQIFDNEGNSTIVCYTGEGELLAEGNYKGQNRDGSWRFYGEGEYLFMIENYQDGLRIGETLILSKEGKVLQRMNYKEGKLDGERIHYYPYGNIMAKYTYVEGVLEGPYTYYFETGHVNEEGNYVQGKANGMWRSYEEDGTFVEVEYVDGEIANPEAYNQSIQNKLDRYDVDPKIKDPEDFMHNPSDYFSL